MLIVNIKTYYISIYKDKYNDSKNHNFLELVENLEKYFLFKQN